MRWLLLVFAIPSIALAKPTVAVAPLVGDKGGELSALVADAVGSAAKVTRPDRVARAMENIGVSTVGATSVKRLRAKLQVDVVIYGKARKQHVDLTIAGRGASSTLSLDFESKKELRKELGNKLARRIESAAESEGAEDESACEESPFGGQKRCADAGDRNDESSRGKARDDEEPRRGKERDDEEPRRGKVRDDEEEPRRGKVRDDEEPRRGKVRDDEEEPRRGKVRDDEEPRRGKVRDDDDTTKRAKNRDDDDDDDDKRVADRDDEDTRDEDDRRDEGSDRKRGKRARHIITQAALWLDAGAGFARRSLDYETTGTMPPPPVGALAPGARIAAELYPAAFSSLRGAAAGLGIAGRYEPGFGLGIAVPNTMNVVAPISCGQYAVGARYRFVFGGSSVALGVSYWSRYFVADRSQLMPPSLLDMPDVRYSAIAPGVTGRFGITRKIGAFANVDLPLMLNSGPIQEPTSYGAARILAFDIQAGAQIALATHFALQLAAEFDQVGLKFTKQAGSMSAARDVSSATDRSIGFTASIGVLY